MRLLIGLILGIAITIGFYELRTDSLDKAQIPDVSALDEQEILSVVKDTFDYHFYEAFEISSVLMDTEPYQQKMAANENYDYYVQVASFSLKDNADAFLADLLLEGYLKPDLFIEKDGLGPYRVMIGPFDDKPSASDTKQWAADHKLSALLVRRQKNA